MPAGLASLVLQAQAFFTIILGAFVFGERLQRAAGGIALAIFGVLVLVEGASAGHVPLVGFYAVPGGGAQLGLRQCASTKKSCPGHAVIISLVVWSAVIRAAVYVCLVADRWPAAHAGESTPDRYADGSLLLYTAFIATLVGYGIWGSLQGAMKPGGCAAVAAGAGSGDGQRCAAAGETLSGLQLAGAALMHGPGSISTFSVCVWCGLAWRAGKKPRRRGYTQVCV